jgi:hypothetical protein
MSEYELGLTILGMEDLETLGLPDPFPVEFTKFDEVYTSGDGGQVGDGFSKINWHFDILTMAQWFTLTDHLGNAQSAQLFVRTTTDAGNSYANLFATFQAFMIRPKIERALGRLLLRNIDIEFVSAEEQ